MKHIKNIVGLVLLLLALNSAELKAQCYQLEIDHIGAEAFEHEMLETTACELRESIGYTGPESFDVLAFNLYPPMALAEPEFEDDALDGVDAILANKDFYLAIIKKVKYDENIYSLSGNHSIEYVLKYNLPTENSNVNLSGLDRAALLEILQKKVNEDILESGNTVISEINLMQELGKNLDGLNTEESLDALGYEFVPTDGIDLVRSETLTTPIGNQFSRIELKEENGNGWLDISALAPTTIDSLYTDLTVNLITSSSLDETSISSAINQLNLVVDNVFNIHIHHDTEKDGLYFRSKLTKNTATTILNAEFQSRLI